MHWTAQGIPTIQPELHHHYYNTCSSSVKGALMTTTETSIFWILENFGSIAEEIQIQLDNTQEYKSLKDDLYRKLSKVGRNYCMDVEEIASQISSMEITKAFDLGFKIGAQLIQAINS